MPAKRDIDFNNKKAYGLKSVTLKDQDATPVGDLLLKDVDQVLRVRDSGDQADKSIAVSSVPDLPASKITSETLALDRIPTPLTGKDADSVDGHNLDQDVLTTSTPTFAAVKTAKIYPLSDGTSAVVITKADGSTIILNVDSTNKKVGFNTNAPIGMVHIKGDPNWDNPLLCLEGSLSDKLIKFLVDDYGLIIRCMYSAGNKGFAFRDMDDDVILQLTRTPLDGAHDHRVGINQSDPSNVLHVFAPNAVLNSFLGGISVYASDLNAANVGGLIRFGGRTVGFPTGYPLAVIKGAFENASDFKGFMAFATSLGDGTITEKMRLTSAGYLGINQTAPSDLLHITKDGSVYAYIHALTGSGQVAGIRLQRGTWLADIYTDWGISDIGGVLTFTSYESGSTLDRVKIAADGKVGIGCDPSYTLDISGSIRRTGDDIIPVKDAAPSDTPPVGTMRFVRLGANQNRIYVYTADGWQWHHFGGTGLQWWSDGVPYP